MKGMPWPSRTVVLSADDQPFPVVFEMGGFTVVVPPRGHLRLVVTGPPEATLEIGHGSQGVSIFRDGELTVRVYDHDERLLDIPGFA